MFAIFGSYRETGFCFVERLVVSNFTLTSCDGTEYCWDLSIISNMFIYFRVVNRIEIIFAFYLWSKSQ